MTPGEAEPGTEPHVSVDVIFSEVLPNPEGRHSIMATRRAA